MDWLAHNQQSVGAFIPELILVGGALTALLLGAFRPKARGAAIGIGILALAAYIPMAAKLFGQPETENLFSGMITADPFAVFFKIFFGVVTLTTIVFVSKSNEFKNYSFGEIIGFLLALTLGMSMMAASTDILMMYLSLEMVSVLSYIMVGYKMRSRVSSEAGLKYIIYGAFSSGIMIFGLSYIFGLVGSTQLADIALYFKGLKGISHAPVILFALLCTMMGLGFKIATFPTQMWCPDVYEGAALPVTAFLSVGPKAAGFAMTVRFFVTAFSVQDGRGTELFHFIHWELVIAVLAAATMTIGNLAAIPQRNLKRLMAYSSIAHAGYLLMGFAAFNQAGVQAMLFYLVAYLLMNLGTFLIILIVANRLGTEEIDGYRGLGWRSPLLASLLTIFLFSLTGLPPFAGFIGKLLIFAAVVNKGIYWLAVVAALNMVISLFYYARILRAMWMESAFDSSPIAMPRLAGAVTLAMAIPTTFLILYWEPVIRWTEISAQSLF